MRVSDTVYRQGDEEYYTLLKEMFGLVESNRYGQNFYGTPWACFYQAFSFGRVAYWVAEPNGVAIATPKLIEQGIGVIPVCIVPESAA